MFSVITIIFLLVFLQCYDTQTTQVVIPSTSQVEMEICLRMKTRLQSVVNGTDSIVCQDLTREEMDVFDAIKAVTEGIADVAMTSGDELITVKRSGLIPIILSNERINMGMIGTASMVSNVGLDLRQKRGCFRRNLDAGTLGLGIFLKSQKYCNRSGEYDIIIAEILADACMPSIRDTWLKPSLHLTTMDQDRMCNLCYPTPDSPTAASCKNDRYNDYAGDIGVFKCLEDKRSDFAVVALDGALTLPNGTNIICPNGTTVDNLQSVDNGCLLTSVPARQFVVRRSDKRRKEIRDILLQALDLKQFYGVFASPQLTQEEITFNNIDKCQVPPVVSSSISFWIIILIICIVVVCIIVVPLCLLFTHRGRLFLEAIRGLWTRRDIETRSDDAKLKEATGIPQEEDAHNNPSLVTEIFDLKVKE